MLPHTPTELLLQRQKQELQRCAICRPQLSQTIACLQASSRQELLSCSAGSQEG